VQAAMAGQRAPLSPGRWLRPLGSYGLTVFVLINLNFFLPRSLPGDPVGALAAQASPGLGASQRGPHWPATTGWTVPCSSSMAITWGALPTAT